MTGRYKAYSEYKDSGIDWVGEVPSSWVVKPTFSVFDPQVTKNTEGQETKVLSLSYGNIVERDVETNFGLLPESFNTYQIVDDGDLILRLTDLQNDKKSLRVGMVKQRGIITSAYLKLRASNSIEPRFAYRLLHSYDTTKVFYGMGGGLRQSMKFEDFRRLPILVPPLDEQRKIANFLDHETAKIDTLITKQEKLIELLKEKRQAVISHAVTKGLNPDAPMKDSGVEWLGEVPDRWSVGRVKNLAKLISKGTTPSTIGGDFVDSGIRFLKGENIGKSIFVNPSPAFHISEEVDAQLSRSRLQENDVLVIIAGATTGKASILTKELLPANTNQAVSFIRPKRADYSKLIAFWLSTDFAQRVIWMGAVQAAQPNLSMENLGNLPIVLPTEDEIAPLLFEIDKKIEHFDVLVQKAHSAIKLMKERKTALISAAVTGKIDVRDWEVK
ncbi:restriction endonuclease subunit S [Photobacterium damselae subsp. damselae]|uniref:restriction endonuclease subunit S n=1 Tax=Photobacterium damselae TaxID=38293 RepID=UPI00311B1798